MELDEHGFLEELLALRRDTWENFPAGMADIFPSEAATSFECFDDGHSSAAAVATVPDASGAFGANAAGFSMAMPTGHLAVGCLGGAGAGGVIPYCLFGNEFPADQIQGSSPAAPTSCGEDVGLVHGDGQSCGGGGNGVVCKVEVGVQQQQQQPAAGSGMGFEMVSSSSTSSCCLDRKNRVRKAEGQPSKNLMAERRRRKRLNDRLSMLRSVVPKISKMDRTSILGDTIDYMKELLERIKGLQGEIEVDGSGDGSIRHSPNLLGIFKDMNPNEILVRNTPQFDVVRRELDTRVEICCAGKPGLLLSTINTLEALGMDIQQCVVSCFNDFGMQASCSEDMDQRAVISVDEIKQVLFRNAGYGGRCV